jgi:hypothetical protein
MSNSFSLENCSPLMFCIRFSVTAKPWHDHLTTESTEAQNSSMGKGKNLAAWTYIH